MTAKIIVLLALASGERRSSLVACVYSSTFNSDGMSVSFCKNCVFKSYCLRKGQSVTLLLSISSVFDDNLLQVYRCRTMQFYLDTFAAFCSPAHRSLFIPYVVGSDFTRHL